jgi:tellurite resistance protein TehA-like permease
MNFLILIWILWIISVVIRVFNYKQNKKFNNEMDGWK